MIEFGNLIENNKQYKDLISQKQNCASFLFSSQDEVLVSNFCYMFAKFLLCSGENKPCGVCESCKKVDLLSHSDLIIYPKNHKGILVDDIKNLIENVYLSPIESDKKVFVLNNFSLATIQSQNKLLKILEEPPKNVYIILGVTNESKVLPTIFSRCKKIRLNKLDDNDIKFALQEKANESVVDLSSGDLTKAIKFSSDSFFLDCYNNCLDTLKNMKDSKMVLNFSAKLVSKKGEIGTVLTILESFYRDMLLIRLRQEQLVKNQNILGDLRVISQDYDADAIDKVIKKLYEVKRAVDFNCNESYLMDNLLLYILEVKYLCKL